MEELWQKTSELLWQRPMLWVPVLTAELLGFFVSLGAVALLRGMLLHGMQYHSALGGAPVQTPLNHAGMEHATIIALLLSWTANFLRMLLYAVALISTAALVHGFAKRSSKPLREVGPALQSHAADILSLGLRALAIYIFVALLVEWAGQWLVAHGHKAALANGWLEMVGGAVLFAALAWSLARAAVWALIHRQLPSQWRRRAQIFAFSLGIVALLLGRFVSTNMRSVRITSVTMRDLLQVMGSWIAALPYTVAFVGLAIIALHCEREVAVEPGAPV